MEIRLLELAELARVSEIDVTEDGSVVLEQRGVAVTARAGTWSRPPRPADRWTEFEARWRAFVPDGGAAIGAFEGGRLVGIAIMLAVIAFNLVGDGLRAQLDPRERQR